MIKDLKNKRLAHKLAGIYTPQDYHTGAKNGRKFSLDMRQYPNNKDITDISGSKRLANIKIHCEPLDDHSTKRKFEKISTLNNSGVNKDLTLDQIDFHSSMKRNNETEVQMKTLEQGLKHVFNYYLNEHIKVSSNHTFDEIRQNNCSFTLMKLVKFLSDFG